MKIDLRGVVDRHDQVVLHDDVRWIGVIDRAAQIVWIAVDGLIQGVRSQCEAERHLAGIESFDSFECRGQNRIVGAKMSEHGRANALDIRAIRLKSGRVVRPTDPGVSEDFRIAMRTSVCTRFTTVLGPGSDGYHEDHIHLDLMQRRNNYKICQWYVWDAMPQTAPLLPADRPEEAPPREVAAEPDAAKPDSATPKPAAASPATKKRR